MDVMAPEMPRVVEARQSDEIDQLAEALAAAQGEIENPPRDRTVTVRMKTGGSYKYSYATLGAIRNAYRKPLSEQGLAISSVVLPSGRQGEAELRVRLMHKSGQWIESIFFLDLRAKDPQDVGKLITYYTRYSISGLLNIAADDDNEGQDTEDGGLVDASDRHPSGRKTPTAVSSLVDVGRAMEMALLKDRLLDEIIAWRDVESRDKLWERHKQDLTKLRNYDPELYTLYQRTFKDHFQKLEEAAKQERVARAEDIIDHGSKPNDESQPTTAEVIDDEIPALAEPQKPSADEWLVKVEEALRSADSQHGIHVIQHDYLNRAVLDEHPPVVRQQFEKLVRDATEELWWVSTLIRNAETDADLEAFRENGEVREAYLKAKKARRHDVIKRIDSEYDAKAKQLGVPPKKQENQDKG